MALVYDDTLLREPGLLIPGRKPVWPVRLNPNHWQARGLAGYWPFLGDFRDYSGNGNHGTNNGATWVGSSRGRVLDFDGSDDYVAMPEAVDLDQSDWSYSIWFKADTLPNDVSLLRYNSSTPDEHLYIDDDDKLKAFFVKTRGKTTGYTVSADTWYHAVAVYQAGSSVGTYKMYVNGNLETSNSGTSYEFTADGTAFTIAHRAPNRDYFNGLIDDVRIYNRALSASEVRGIYLDSYALLVPA